MSQNISSLFTNLESKVPTKDRINTVYKVNCNKCPKCYIGQSKQHLKNRMRGHKYEVKQQLVEKSALASYALTLGHTFDFDNAQVVDNESNLYKRLIKEIHISQNDSVNKRTDIQNLSHLYSVILDLISRFVSLRMILGHLVIDYRFDFVM